MASVSDRQIQQIGLKDCFPEDRGFVLCDPERLDSFHDGQAQGDLLTAYSTSDQGNRVSAQGIAIPIYDVEPDYYTVVVRGKNTESTLSQPLVRSPGWVLGTESGRLVLCGAGYLRDWNSQDPRFKRFSIPPGWYAVEIQAGFSKAAPEQGVYEFVLSPTQTQPDFTADLSMSFNLMDLGE